MKNKRQFLIPLFMFFVGCFSALAYSFFREWKVDRETGQQTVASKALDWERENFFEALGRLSRENVTADVFVESLLEMFPRLLGNDSRDALYAVAQMELFVRDNPRMAAESFKSGSVKFSSAEIRQAYVMTFFSALAKFYPQDFFSYFISLNTEKSLLRGNEIPAFNSFFDMLIFENPKQAYDLLLSSDMEKLSTDNPLLKDVLAGQLRILACYLGVDNMSFFSKQLSLVDNSRVRGNMLDALAKSAFSYNQLSILANWMKEHLGIAEQNSFVIALLVRAAELESEEQALFLLADRVGVRNAPLERIEEIVKALSKADLLLTLDFTERYLEGLTREQALSVVFDEMIRRRSAKALLPVFDSLSNGYCKHAVFPKLFSKYYEQSPDEAVAWLLDGKLREMSVNSSDDSFYRDFFAKLWDEELGIDSDKGRLLYVRLFHDPKADENIKNEIANKMLNASQYDKSAIMTLFTEKEKEDLFRWICFHTLKGDHQEIMSALKENDLDANVRKEILTEIFQTDKRTFPDYFVEYAREQGIDPDAIESPISDTIDLDLFSEAGDAAQVTGEYNEPTSVEVENATTEEEVELNGNPEEEQEEVPADEEWDDEEQDFVPDDPEIWEDSSQEQYSF